MYAWNGNGVKGICVPHTCIIITLRSRPVQFSPPVTISFTPTNLSVLYSCCFGHITRLAAGIVDFIIVFRIALMGIANGWSVLGICHSLARLDLLNWVIVMSICDCGEWGLLQQWVIALMTSSYLHMAVCECLKQQHHHHHHHSEHKIGT